MQRDNAMSIVALVSGGIDSSLMALLIRQEGIDLYPVFIDYGQLGAEKEWAACKLVHSAHGLPRPYRIDLSGFGSAINSGLTDSRLDIVADAFLPGRNLLFLLTGGAYAFQRGANAVSIGLLREDTHLFPDQTKAFLQAAENSISASLARRIKIIAPLIEFHKAAVIQLAGKYGIDGTYSCHAGGKEPCGICISCREILLAKTEEG